MIGPVSPAVERGPLCRMRLAGPGRGGEAHDLLSDVVWVCDDYQEPDAFYVELQVVMINRADQEREAILRGFQTLASTAGAIFPAALPYAALGEGALAAIT